MEKINKTKSAPKVRLERQDRRFSCREHKPKSCVKKSKNYGNWNCSVCVGAQLGLIDQVVDEQHRLIVHVGNRNLKRSIGT